MWITRPHNTKSSFVAVGYVSFWRFFFLVVVSSSSCLSECLLILYLLRSHWSIWALHIGFVAFTRSIIDICVVCRLDVMTTMMCGCTRFLLDFWFCYVFIMRHLLLLAWLTLTAPHLFLATLVPFYLTSALQSPQASCLVSCLVEFLFKFHLIWNSLFPIEIDARIDARLNMWMCMRMRSRTYKYMHECRRGLIRMHANASQSPKMGHFSWNSLNVKKKKKEKKCEFEGKPMTTQNARKNSIRALFRCCCCCGYFVIRVHASLFDLIHTVLMMSDKSAKQTKQQAKWKKNECNKNSCLRIESNKVNYSPETVVVMRANCSSIRRE